MALEEIHTIRDLRNREQPGFVAIVEVGGVVGNFVGKVDKLRFERRPLIEQILGKLRMLPGSVIVRVLDDALADFKRQIQPAESGITQFEVLDNAERMQVVIKRKPVLSHGGVERFFSRVAKRRVAEVVNQRKRLRQIGVQAKLRGDGARDLRDLNGVSQPVAEMVGVTAGENLRLCFQAAKGAGMDDTVTVALKIVAVGMPWLGMAASAGVFYAHRIVGEHGESLAFFILIRTAKAFRTRGGNLLYPTQLVQHFRSFRDLEDGGGNLAPALTPVFVDHKRRADGDIGVTFTTRVKQPVLPSHERLGVAEYDELVGSLLVPNHVGMFLIVHADRYQARFRLFEFTGMLRELAQLAHADRSPVAAIENQNDARSAQT